MMLYDINYKNKAGEIKGYPVPIININEKNMVGKPTL